MGFNFRLGRWGLGAVVLLLFWLISLSCLIRVLEGSLGCECTDSPLLCSRVLALLSISCSFAMTSLLIFEMSASSFVCSDFKYADLRAVLCTPISFSF